MAAHPPYRKRMRSSRANKCQFLLVSPFCFLFRLFPNNTTCPALDGGKEECPGTTRAGAACFHGEDQQLPCSPVFLEAEDTGNPAFARPSPCPAEDPQKTSCRLGSSAARTCQKRHPCSWVYRSSLLQCLPACEALATHSWYERSCPHCCWFPVAEHRNQSRME